jgi:hypothetical protein
MGKSIFNSTFKRSKTFDIEDVNFDVATQRGTCKLVSKHYEYVLIWSITTYPPETPSMPGAPYPLLVSYTIFDGKDKFDKSLKSNNIVYDTVVCNNDVILGKPEPFMLYKIMNRFNVPARKCIKVGESSYNVIEGLNAKIDTINVIDSSNLMAMDEQMFDDSCESIKYVKRMEVINKLMNSLELKTEIDKKVIKLFDTTRIKTSLFLFD